MTLDGGPGAARITIAVRAGSPPRERRTGEDGPSRHRQWGCGPRL